MRAARGGVGFSAMAHARRAAQASGQQCAAGDERRFGARREPAVWLCEQKIVHMNSCEFTGIERNTCFVNWASRGSARELPWRPSQRESDRKARLRGSERAKAVHGRLLPAYRPWVDHHTNYLATLQHDLVCHRARSVLSPPFTSAARRVLPRTPFARPPTTHPLT